MIDEYESIVTAKSAEDMLKGKWSSMRGIVRCKDCKKWETINCPFARDFVKWDGFKFCAWGERKEDD